MSGGIGYFLDLDPTLLNTEMVDALVPTDADHEFLRKLITRHHEETGSDVRRVIALGLAYLGETLHQGVAARLRARPCCSATS
jgi:glutamate synthase domain-containing protein 3